MNSSLRRRRLALVLATAIGFAVPAMSGAGTPVGTVPSAHAAAKGDPKDCSDFRTHRQAQRWFKHHHPHRDPAGLDADHDGKACEWLP